MNKLVKFLNSGLGLLVVGSLVGTIGLFTWQRRDWVFKQEYLRAQIMLDRKIDLIERINSDVGYLLADANGIIAVVAKKAPGNQEKAVIELYNEEQARWFGVSVSHQALLKFYFPSDLSKTFEQDVVKATKRLDMKLFLLTKKRNKKDIQAASAASNEVHRQLQQWNGIALENLKTK